MHSNIMDQDNPSPRQDVLIVVNTPSLDTARNHSESPSDAYARLLLAKRIGYPLWGPGPSHQPSAYHEEGVRIGDLGTITFDGRFHFIFNVCLPATHPVNVRAPPSLIHLGFREDEVERIPLASAHGQVIRTDSVQGDPTDYQWRVVLQLYFCYSDLMCW
jgi:hypothetical protein